MTHAGELLRLPTRRRRSRAMAEQERGAVVRAAERLRAAGLRLRRWSASARRRPPLFAHNARRRHRSARRRLRLLRPGDGRHRRVRVEDIALSVLATVIGHQREKGWVHHRRRLDGDVARPRHREAGGRLGLRPRVRRGGRPHRRLASCPAPTRSTASSRVATAAPTRHRRRCRSARGCASCPTTPAPPARSTTLTTSCANGTEVVEQWPRFSGW